MPTDRSPFQGSGKSIRHEPDDMDRGSTVLDALMHQARAVAKQPGAFHRPVSTGYGIGSVAAIERLVILTADVRDSLTHVWLPLLVHGTLFLRG